MTSFYDSVLMLGWEYPPHNSGGLGVACEGLTHALSDQNTQIYFTLPYQHSSSLGHMTVMSCVDPTWEVDGTQQPPFSVYSQVRIPSPTNPLDVNDLLSLPQSELEHRVAQYADRVSEVSQPMVSQVDLIHAHDWMSFPAAAKLKAATGKPVVAHIHSTELDRIPGGSGSSYIQQTEVHGLQMADRVIAVSFYTKRLLIEKYGISAKKIDVVHNGVSVLKKPINSTSSFAHGRPVIVFMGRLTAQKGGEYFIRLAQKVLAVQPDALFVVAGDGDMYRHLLFQAAYDKLSASVLFTGFIRDEKREKLLSRADIFVMPSVSEPFGLVALEAAQRHTPVIVSKQSGVSEVLPSAISIDFWDVDKMYKTILELLENKALAASVVQGQLSELDSVSWKKAAGQVRDTYKKLFLGI